MREADISAAVLSNLSKIFNKFKYGIMFYDPQLDKAFIIEDGNLSPSFAYKKIKTLLDDDAIYRVSINNSDLSKVDTENIYLNFVRIKIDGSNFVIIFPDNKKYSINSSFIAGLVCKILSLGAYLNLQNNEIDEFKDFLINNLPADNIAINIETILGSVSNELDTTICNEDLSNGSLEDSKLKAENIQLKELLRAREEELRKLNGYSGSSAESSSLSSHDDFIKRFNELKNKMDETIIRHKQERDEWEAEREKLISSSVKNPIGSYSAVGLKKDKDSNTVSIDKDELDVLRDNSSQLPLVRAHLDSATWELRDKNNIISSLKDEIAKLKSGAPSSTPRSVDLAHNLGGVSPDAKIAELKDRIDMLEDLSIKQQIKINAKEEEIKELRDSDPQELRKLRAELESKHLKISSLELDVDAMSAEKKYYINEISELNATIESLKKDINSKATVKDGLDETTTRLDNKIVDLSRSLELANTSISRLESLLLDSKNNLKEKESAIEKKQQEIRNMEIVINNLNDALSSANNKLAESSSELKSLNKVRDDLKVITEEKNRLSLESKSKDNIFESFYALVAHLNSELNELAINNSNYFPSLPALFCSKKGDANWKELLDVCKRSNTNYADIESKLIKGKESVNVILKISDAHGDEEYSATFFPIQDMEGNVSPFVAVENTGIISAIKASFTLLSNNKDSLSNVIDGHDDNLKELSLQLENVTKDNELLKEKNIKIMKVLKKLTADTDPSNVIALKSELLSYKNKFGVAEDLLKKYKVQLEQLTLRYADLNVKTYLQLEKVFDYLKNSSQVSDADVISGMSLVEKELKQLKSHLNRNKILAVDPKEKKL